MCGRNILQWIGNELTDHILKVLAGEGGSGRAPKKKKANVGLFSLRCHQLQVFNFLLQLSKDERRKKERKASQGDYLFSDGHFDHDIILQWWKKFKVHSSLVPQSFLLYIEGNGKL